MPSSGKRISLTGSSALPSARVGSLYRMCGLRHFLPDPGHHGRGSARPEGHSQRTPSRARDRGPGSHPPGCSHGALHRRGTLRRMPDLCWPVSRPVPAPPLNRNTSGMNRFSLKSKGYFLNKKFIGISIFYRV